ncbi:MAG TPA: hypothetical protein VGM70_03395 [Pseudolysinimonas sp.]|jgi:hypothetical protein
MTQTSPSSLPSENLQRGVIFALIALPVGVVAWDILWGIGFVASIVAFGVAYFASRLYRFGSGGRVSRNGAIAIAVITIGTLVIAFISGFAVDIVGEYSRVTGASIPESLVSGRFWGIVFASMTTGQALISLLLAALFGALGCFSILRSAFRQTRPVPDPNAAPTIVDPNSPYGASPVQPTLMNPTPAIPAPPVAPPAPSSPGVVLNGQPVEPDQPDHPRDKK